MIAAFASGGLDAVTTAMFDGARSDYQWNEKAGPHPALPLHRETLT